MYLYDGDYNPEQWIDNPKLVKEDIKKLKDANINTVTFGMLCWSKLQPTEDKYDFAIIEL